MTLSRKEDRRPSMQWYPDKWLTDGELHRCGWAARGLWIEILQHMWYSSIRGTLPGDPDRLVMLVGGDVRVVAALLKELDVARVFERGSKVGDGLPPDEIVNRLMYRKWKAARDKHASKVKAGKASAQARKSTQFNRGGNRRPTEGATEGQQDANRISTEETTVSVAATSGCADSPSTEVQQNTPPPTPTPTPTPTPKIDLRECQKSETDSSQPPSPASPSPTKPDLLEAYPQLVKMYDGIWAAIKEAHEHVKIPRPGTPRDLKARKTLADLVRLDNIGEQQVVDVLRWVLRGTCERAEFNRGQLHSVGQLRVKWKNELTKFANFDEAYKLTTKKRATPESQAKADPNVARLTKIVEAGDRVPAELVEGLMRQFGSTGQQGPPILGRAIEILKKQIDETGKDQT